VADGNLGSHRQHPGGGAKLRSSGFVHLDGGCGSAVDGRNEDGDGGGGATSSR